MDYYIEFISLGKRCTYQNKYTLINAKYCLYWFSDLKIKASDPLVVVWF